MLVQLVLLVCFLEKLFGGFDLNERLVQGVKFCIESRLVAVAQIAFLLNDRFSHLRFNHSHHLVRFAGIFPFKGLRLLHLVPFGNGVPLLHIKK